MLDALNVKYIVASRAIALPENRYQLVAQFHDEPEFVFYQGLDREDVFIYQSRDCLPRAFWVSGSSTHGGSPNDGQVRRKQPPRP